MKLSDVAVRQAKTQDKRYKLTDGTALYLLLNQAGKSWRYDYRFEGKRKTISYGVYPLMTLSRAREAHMAAKRELILGRDPMATRKSEKQADAMAFKAVAGKWCTHWKAGKTEKHVSEVWRRLELH
jgi:hypothetical protein